MFSGVIIGCCSLYGDSLADDVSASPFFFVVEENFPSFEGKTTVFEVDTVEGA
jgi:hypothetical protein